MELMRSSLSSLHAVDVNYPTTSISPVPTTMPISIRGQSRLPCFATPPKCKPLQVEPRRTANYHPSIWDPKLIESLNNSYAHEFHATKLEELKLEAKRLLVCTKDPCVLLKLIDSMQRLGVAYHFQLEIKEALDHVKLDVTGDLYTTALQFRLLREHGYSVSTDIFEKFKDGDGRFMESIGKDVAGLLSLYEASQLGRQGEIVLEQAKNFSAQNLKSFLRKVESSGSDIAEQVQQSLELPLHWRMPRAEARSFIHVYQKDDTKSLILLELAKLDYNIVQAAYQRELKELASWWRDLGIMKELSFSRDRLVENYLWAMGIVFEPHFYKCRIALTKLVCILTAIDDMYDVYGSLDELELYTDAVTRWDLSAMEALPDYMKICYLAMFNFGNEFANDVQKDHDLNALSFIKREWGNLCKSYLKEARWHHTGYTPTLKQYLENAWISVGGPGAMVHAYLSLGCTMSKDSLDSCFKHASHLIYWSSLIGRLCNDLGTSQAESIRGDVTKSTECFIMEEGESEEEAREHIRGLIRHSWEMLNEENANSQIPKPMVKMCLNMARTAHYIFQHGDGIGTSTGLTKDRITSLLLDPIPIKQF
ncbi:Terpene_synth domain-containing protein/Terpene_synth_C domain-containing protein [Cephalotus follicularis]|uniref:Terpene_synth domain-containing protein/Terpene_synth_C domain-containing protein n=1 Tax=Cephalotus follicularis TaxID=3775 RepID=A0A1Q3CIK9_CEPFO|nr:Terpene_synth domain-containing protein/Terpene_synth_C domain-containing protein [Cephalotus follicularis]